MLTILPCQLMLGPWPHNLPTPGMYTPDTNCVCVMPDNLNTRHRNAQMAGRASIELYTLIYFYGKQVVADARVLQVCVVRVPGCRLQQRRGYG